MSIRETKAVEYLKLAVEKGYSISPGGDILGPKGKLRGSIHKRKYISRVTGEMREYSYWSFNIRLGPRVTRRVLAHQLHGYQLFGDACLQVGIVVRHLNGDSLDNSEGNMGYGTDEDNSKDRTAEERQLSGQNAANARKAWSDDDVRRLRAQRANGGKVLHMAKMEGVSKSQMSMMLSGATYRSVRDAQ